MSEIEMMLICSPVGSPYLRICPTRYISGLQSFFPGRRTGRIFSAYATQRTPDMSWDSTVAMAAPATPIGIHDTKATSRITFSMLETIRKMRGTTEFPMARRTADAKLYSIVAPQPA